LYSICLFTCSVLLEGRDFAMLDVFITWLGVSLHFSHQFTSLSFFSAGWQYSHAKFLAYKADMHVLHLFANQQWGKAHKLVLVWPSVTQVVHHMNFILCMFCFALCFDGCLRIGKLEWIEAYPHKLIAA
jgi:hypothetical protein